MPPPYSERRAARPGAVTRLISTPGRWLVRLHPLQSWLVVMAVIIGLSMIGLRTLALLIAIGWTAYAVYTWLSPSAHRRRAAAELIELLKGDAIEIRGSSGSCAA